MQLVDELAMIYTTCFMVHATFAYARSFHFSVALGVGLTGLAYYITVWNKCKAIALAVRINQTLF